MKKLLFTLTIAFISLAVKAQVPNGSFEIKEQAKFKTTIKNWRTLGTYSHELDDNYGIGINFYDETDQGAMISDATTDDFDMAKGFAINARPDSLIVWMTFYVDDSDTLVIRTKNRETQNDFGYGELKINGSENEVKRFAIAIKYTSPGFADSGVIQAYMQQASAGSYYNLTVYKMQFVNFLGNTVSAIPNADFDQWNQDSIELPKFWTSLLYSAALEGIKLPGQGEKFVSGASQGNSAIQINNILYDAEYFSGAIYAIPYTSFENYNGSLDEPEAMFPITKRYVKLTGDYKYTVTGLDTALVQVAMFKDDGLVSVNNYYIYANQNTYKTFTIDIDYDTFNGVPDYASIVILSGLEDNAKAGTSLTIDNLVFEEVNSIDKQLPSFIKMYPNPANDKLNIYSTEGKINSVFISNLQGKTLIEAISNFSEIPLTALSTGAYLISVNIDGITYTKKIFKL